MIRLQTNLRVKSFVGDDVRRESNASSPNAKPVALKFQQASLPFARVYLLTILE